MKASYNVMTMYNSAFVFLDRALRVNDLAVLMSVADEALGGMYIIFLVFPT